MGSRMSDVACRLRELEDDPGEKWRGKSWCDLREASASADQLEADQRGYLMREVVVEVLFGRQTPAGSALHPSSDPQTYCLSKASHSYS